jgi:hypothetical protein
MTYLIYFFKKHFDFNISKTKLKFNSLEKSFRIKLTIRKIIIIYKSFLKNALIKFSSLI